MDYVLLNEYNLFIENKRNHQDSIERYIQECKILSESSKNKFNKIQSLNEGVTDKIKEGFTKIIDFIKKMWAKFMEKLTAFVAKDKTYLEKYKDIILKKKPKEATYTMYDYANGIKNIVSTSVPMFNYDSLKDKLADNLTFEKFITQGKTPAYDGKVEFVDYCKDLFRGSLDEKEFKSNAINMTDVYNYCNGYNSMQDKIKKDITTIESAALSAGKVIDALPKPAAETGTKTENYLFANPITYSSVYETYITEMDIKKDEPSTPDKAEPAQDSTSAAKQVSNITKGTEKAEDDDTKASASASNEELTVAKDKINRYLSICSTLFTAKLTISEEIYKGYMQIIRSHVSDFVGTGEKSDKLSQTGTNYGELTQEQENAITEVIGNKETLTKQGYDWAIEKLNSIKDITSSTKDTIISGLKAFFKK